MEEVKMKIFASKTGFFFSGIFFIVAMYFILPILRSGNTESGFFVIIAAWPISILAHEVSSVAQNIFAISHQARSWTEVIAALCLGLIQYYLVGYLIESLFHKIKGVRRKNAVRDTI